MAKSPFPMPKTGSGLLPKVTGALVLVALFMFMVKHPSEAASLVQSGASGLGSVVEALVTFFQALGQ